MYLLCYFFPLNLSHYYTSSLVGMKKNLLNERKKNPKQQNPKQPPQKQHNCPGASKLNFKVSLLVFLARRKVEPEISSEIHTAKQNAEKSPPANIKKRAEMWKAENIQTKTTFKIYYMEW